MQVKYAGPKAVVNKDGVSFDNSKDDKYIYLNIIIQLIEAIDIEHIPEKIYSYDKKNPRLSDEKIHSYIISNYDNSDDLLKLAEEEAELSFAHELEIVKKYPNITEQEREIWTKNLMFMKQHNIQRIYNGKIFRLLVEKLANIIKSRQIEYILTPMYPNFMKILHSAHIELYNQKPSINSIIEIIPNDKNELDIKFNIKG